MGDNSFAVTGLTGGMQVRELMLRISVISLIPVDKMRLLVDGEEVFSEETLSDKNIAD